MCLLVVGDSFNRRGSSPSTASRSARCSASINFTHRAHAAALQVAIDLNAVPPAGIEGVEATDAGENRDRLICYGALGVGGMKMKIHRAAVAKLFERNDQVLDAEAIYELAQQL